MALTIGRENGRETPKWGLVGAATKAGFPSAILAEGGKR